MNEIEDDRPLPARDAPLRALWHGAVDGWATPGALERLAGPPPAGRRGRPRRPDAARPGRRLRGRLHDAGGTRPRAPRRGCTRTC
ncbi:hypothetical protein ACFQ1I_15345 [Kitasatospora arboriphila]